MKSRCELSAHTYFVYSLRGSVNRTAVFVPVAFFGRIGYTISRNTACRAKLPKLPQSVNSDGDVSFFRFIGSVYRTRFFLSAIPLPPTPFAGSVYRTAFLFFLLLFPPVRRFGLPNRFLFSLLLFPPVRRFGLPNRFFILSSLALTRAPVRFTEPLFYFLFSCSHPCAGSVYRTAFYFLFSCSYPCAGSVYRTCALTESSAGIIIRLLSEKLPAGVSVLEKCCAVKEEIWQIFLIDLNISASKKEKIPLLWGHS